MKERHLEIGLDGHIIEVMSQIKPTPEVETSQDIGIREINNELQEIAKIHGIQDAQDKENIGKNKVIYKNCA